MDKAFNRLAAFLAFCVVLLGTNGFSQVENAGFDAWLGFLILLSVVCVSTLTLIFGEIR